jgi:predicted ester cyclase
VSGEARVNDGGTETTTHATAAKRALERVCSGAGDEPASRYYSAAFVDHVNGQELRGVEGVEQSVATYRRMLDDMAIAVEQQVTSGDLVTSRFVVTGSIYGRRVCFDGITISRFENGLIVEDWSVTDTLGMLRQAGVIRSLLMMVRSLRGR